MPKAIVLIVRERMVLVDKQIKLYYQRVKQVICRDYLGGQECDAGWAERVLQNADMQAFYQDGYTEEAAAQKIYEENTQEIETR